MFFGKLHTDGTLTDISAIPPAVVGGESVVNVVTMPDGVGPFRYDAGNQLAVQLLPATLLSLITSLNALTAGQKTAVWTDITSGVPPKWSLDAGPNAAALAVLQLLAAGTTLNAADLLAAKIRGVAMYIQDNPGYLVHPAFDATINIPGRA